MTTASALPVRAVDLRLQLRADDREAPESAVDEVLVQLVVVVQDIAEDCREKHQQREYGEEPVVRDERRLAARLVVAELLQDRKGKPEHIVSLLELVRPADEGLHRARPMPRALIRGGRRGSVPASESTDVPGTVTTPNDRSEDFPGSQIERGPTADRRDLSVRRKEPAIGAP